MKIVKTPFAPTMLYALVADRVAGFSNGRTSKVHLTLDVNAAADRADALDETVAPDETLTPDKAIPLAEIRKHCKAKAPNYTNAPLKRCCMT